MMQDLRPERRVGVLSGRSSTSMAPPQVWADFPQNSMPFTAQIALSMVEPFPDFFWV